MFWWCYPSFNWSDYSHTKFCSCECGNVAASNSTWQCFIWGNIIDGLKLSLAICFDRCADDSLFYVSFASRDSVSLNGLQLRLASVQSWVSSNKLKMNPNKTEILLIRNERHCSKYLSMFPIKLFGVKLTQQNVLGMLEVIFDNNFTFHSYISAMCSSCFYHILELWRIHRHLDLDSVKLLVTALMCSRLNYCNLHLYHIADTDLTRLRRVQN